MPRLPFPLIEFHLQLFYGSNGPCKLQFIELVEPAAWVE